MTTTADLKFDNFAEMLTEIRALIVRAAGVEGAEDIGSFIPIGQSRGYGEFSNLSEFLDDFADTLQDFLASDGDELEGWHAGTPRGACILTDENIGTEDDCTTHDHE